MSDWAYSIHGGSPVVKKYKMGAANLVVGVPYVISAAGEGGISLGSTTSGAEFIGMGLDAAGIYSTTQGDVEGIVGVTISPDSVWKARMSGSATAGTALSLQAVTTADSAGLAITTAATWSTPTFDEGIVWGYDGANVGKSRGITSVSATAGTVTVPFNATVIGDNFLRAPYFPGGTIAIQLTSNLVEADASIAVGTGGAYGCVDLDLKDLSSEGTLKSMVYFIARDHMFSGS